MLVSALKKLVGLEAKASLADSSGFYFDLFGAAPTLANVVVTPYTAMTCTPVACAVHAISDAAGQLPLHVYRKLPNGGKELALDHPLYTLLHDAPNGWTPSALFRSQVTADSLLQPYGGFAQIVRVDGKPHEIIRLDPQLSSVVIDYSNFEPQYAIRADGKNPAVKIAAADILHIPTPAYNPSRGLVGEGREAIALALVLEQHASLLFGNAARPAGVLSLKGNPTPVALANAKAAWQASQSGNNAGGTAVIPGDASWAPLTFSSVDAQFIEIWTIVIANIARLFRVPLHMLMQMDRAVPRSIEALGQEFLSQSLLPHLIKWEQELS